MKFRNPNDSVINRNKVSTLLRRLRDRLTTTPEGNFDNALANLYRLFEDFFTNLGKPFFRPKKLREGDNPDFAEYNMMVNDISEDLQTAFDEARSAGSIVVNTFNAAQVAAEELNQRSNEAASKTVDLRLFAGQLDQEIIIAGDDFQNTDRVDLSFPVQNPVAEVRIKEGIATLPRIESINVVDQDTRVKVTPLRPLGVNSAPTTDNTTRFYEGDFYDFVGQARPEGGFFHLEERLHPEAVPFSDGDSEIFQTDLSNTGQVFGDAPDQRIGNDRQVGLPLRPEDILVIDRGATPEEKDAIRVRMVDNNPDTFWECEYVVNAESIQNFVTGLDDNQIRDVTPAELRARAVEIDSVENIDLEVQITLELSEQVPINWLSLNPMNFGEMAWLEITEVSTAQDAQAGFEVIEGFDQNRFANVLTDEANEELQPDLVTDVLSPSRYAFRGTAVYSFPVTEAKFVRFKIKQRVPVPDPYQRLAIQLNRTITNTQTYARGDDGGKK